jgi:N-acetylglucosaminyldiphosphoundecaprenol N-acetyl-beta-D-mannosaminyltransferase
VTGDQNSGLAGMFDDGAASKTPIRCVADARQSNFRGSQQKPFDLREGDASPSFPSRVVHSEAELSSFLVLGVRVHAVQMSEALEQLRCWIDDGDPITRYVAVTGMHGIAEARQEAQFRQVLNTADLVVPDGMPLVWLGRIHGFLLRDRVCGSELMDGFCRMTGSAYRHFFFGGAPGVAERLAQALHEKYGIAIAGTYTPPFRALTEAEERNLASMVDKALPDVFWVGLSTPKQEKWMYEHRYKLRVPVMLGVGAAFDMNSGNARRAPAWMQVNGLEWLFRLASEPRRLWKRYLITIPKAVGFVCMELLKSRSTGWATLPKSGSKGALKDRPPGTWR